MTYKRKSSNQLSKLISKRGRLNATNSVFVKLLFFVVVAVSFFFFFFCFFIYQEFIPFKFFILGACKV